MNTENTKQPGIKVRIELELQGSLVVISGMELMNII